ncbi:hypothetical protein K2173_018559 [Erythroxylum novogranatense]|uniref:Uncharacterized protein n=1 Tax=Erythroxylum novogranatense TaxID=1862640 RepID=A0AAV8UAZ1_9ROSI|nr:hypothetical protein K2173_018559 [Erythroxylum novogranatense]
MDKRKSFLICSLVKENPTKMKPFEEQGLAEKDYQESGHNNQGEAPSLSIKSCQLESSHENGSSKCSSSDAHQSKDEQIPLLGVTGGSIEEVLEKEPSGPEATILKEDVCGRERLKRHRIEVGGRVWIPEIWGQEELLKDFIDCSAFDSSLVHSGIMSARAALVEEGRRTNSRGLRIQYRC